MTEQNVIEKRKSPRRLTGLLPGRFVTASDRRDIRMVPLDVSKAGMGCLIGEKFPAGAEFLLLVGDREVRLSVLWVQPDLSKQQLFRYGLENRTPEVDLEQLFETTGCLKESTAPLSLTPQSLSANPTPGVKLYGSKTKKPQKVYRKATRTRYF
jgi:hypothetical protein